MIAAYYWEMTLTFGTVVGSAHIKEYRESEKFGTEERVWHRKDCPGPVVIEPTLKYHPIGGERAS